MKFDPKTIDTFPTLPGVYVMKNASQEVLYVGKGKNIRQRVKQYFAKSGDERAIIPYLTAKIATIEVIVVPTEKEALLLENTLIKQHKPKYNVLLKDDKTYIALKIDTTHPYPKIDVVRYFGNPKEKGRYFGPYPSAHAARETLDLLQKLFPLRQCETQEFNRRVRPCILYDMHACVAPCVQKCTKEAYDDLVNQSIQFLQGNTQSVLKDLVLKMEGFAEALEFEKAQEMLNLIQFIEKTISPQHVDKPIGSDADVIGLFRQGNEATISQLFFRGGTLLNYRHYHFSKIIEEDKELLLAFLWQHYEEKKEVPALILLPFEIEEKGALQELLFSQKKVTLLHPKRGEKLSLLNIALMNAEATFKKEKDTQQLLENTLLDLVEKLKLKRYPKRIECFDNSHFGGDEPVASVVVFIEGKKAPKEYRSYKLRSINPSDDYGAMREVLTRRLKRAEEEDNLPDLLLVDGGKGHLNVAISILKEMNIVSIEVAAIAKEEGRHDKGMSQERVFLPERKDPIFFKPQAPALFLLQQIRDEAHRFVIAFQKKRRSKKTFTSVLDTIPGIGPKTKRKLLKTFGSVKRIQAATEEQLRQAGLTNSQIQAILQFHHREHGDQ